MVYRRHWSGLFDHDRNYFYLTCSSSGIGSTWVMTWDRTTVRGRVRIRLSVCVGVAFGSGRWMMRIVSRTSIDSDVASVSVRIGVSICVGLRATVISITWAITVVIITGIGTYVENVVC